MSIRRWTLVSALLATLATPATALAQSAPPVDPSAFASQVGYDEVSLNNGGMIRGTIAAVEPGKEVAILVQGTTELRHVPWADVAHVSRGKYGPPLEPFAPPPPPPFPEAPPPYSGVPSVGYQSPGLAPPMPGELGAPQLHIDSPMPITLHETRDIIGRRTGPIDCLSPCDRVIDGRAGQTFYFAGDEIPQSDRFHFTEKSGNVVAHVSPGNESLRSAGSTLIVFGILGTIAGAITLPVGLALSSDGSPGSPPSHGASSSSSTIPIAGGVTLGVGAAVTVAGILMNVFGHTRYDFTTSASTPGGFRF